VILKRAFDVVFAILALVITSPIQLFVALAIKLEDGGPVFYKQVRLTKDGREFKLWKYRSMKVGAESDGVARLSAGENDPRITRVGRFIRASRLDEIPQFVNILLGDMSVVGPRPERPEIAAAYEEELPEFKLRLQAKCGLTGYAQVYGKYNSEPYDKLQMDLIYIANPGVAQDLSIIIATLKILFLKDSTEGVEVGQENAMKNGK
jgi:lipopolysaccharide/colanic/teichoic acid biosynthesis glycosyltransferase